MNNEQKNNGPKIGPEGIETRTDVGQYEFDVPKNVQYDWTTEEKAQYEVFRNGELPRETIEQWVTNDLRTIMSFISSVLNEKEVKDALVDAFYQKYLKYHQKPQE